MSRIANYFKNRICLWLLPLLLTTTVGSVLIDCYAPGFKIPLTAAYALFSLSAFFLFDRLHSLRIFGGLLYTVLLIVVAAASLRLVFRGEYLGQVNISFQQWFYGIGTENNDKIAAPYFAALFVAGGFFVNSVLFYFTQIQYRALGTLLIIFIPFVIYAKRDDVMSDLTVTILITLFVAIIVHNRVFLAPDQGKGTVVNTAYVMSVALFVSVTGALAMIFPDFSTPSRLEKDASFLNFAGINGGGKSTLVDRASSTRMHGVKYTNEPVFYVYPEDMKDIEYPIYFRRRAMNAYDPTALDWYAGRDLKNDTSIDSTINVSFPDLYAAERSKGLEDMLPVASKHFKNEYKKHTTHMSIMFEESVGSVPFIPAPLYSEVELEEGRYAMMVSSDYYMVSPAVNASRLGSVDIYSVKCQDEAEDFAAKAGGRFRDFVKTIDEAENTVEQAEQRNKHLWDEDSEPVEGYEFEAFMSEYYPDYYGMVAEHYHFNPEYLRENGFKDYDKVKELADDICKDCKSDYEKAKAIEQYFTDAGFEYDLEYIPEDESVSYFLFESKTGICIDFASAMGVMLMMENVPVRYVEGFVAYERDPEDNTRLIVRDSHAHAFVEAFIPYVGWMTFDPTVAGYLDQELHQEQTDGSSSTLTLILSYLGRILLVMGVLFVLVFIILFDRIWELFFRLRLRFFEPDKKLTHLYDHIFRLLEYEDKTDLKPYTPKLLNDYLRDKTGESLTAVTGLFEQHRFGAKPVTEEQFETAFAAYTALYPKMRRKK